MSPRTNAPATAPAGSGPPSPSCDAPDADSDDVRESDGPRTDRNSASSGDDRPDLRTATRLLRLLKLVLGILVSGLTALRLLGVI